MGREWTVLGGLSGDVEVIRCDGPVPKVNERIPVIEKSSYDALLKQVDELDSRLFDKESERLKQLTEYSKNLKELHSKLQAEREKVAVAKELIKQYQTKTCRKKCHEYNGTPYVCGPEGCAFKKQTLEKLESMEAE